RLRMKRFTLVLACLTAVCPTVALAQRIKVPTAGATSADSAPVLTAEDSARFRARTTAARSPFSLCTGPAFQTCASGETEARLASDGTAYGVLLTRKYDGKSSFLWRITGRVGGAGEPGGAGGKRGGRRSRGGGGGKHRG
ncbi:MAG: hypothetical protein ABI679_02940, partial [Gemmatimonadota bacterium]